MKRRDLFKLAAVAVSGAGVLAPSRAAAQTAAEIMQTHRTRQAGATRRSNSS